MRLLLSAWQVVRGLLQPARTAHTGAPFVTCTYGGSATGGSYDLVSCTGGFQPGDLVGAVIGAGLSDVPDMRAKLDALVAFRSDAAFDPLAEVFKRAINITKAYKGPSAVSEALFEHEEERALHKAAADVSGRVASAAKSGKYAEAFREMARLQPLVSAFFDKVLVMAKDEKVKKATYPALYGIEASREKARELVASALEDILDFGKEADVLRNIAHFVVSRTA